MKLRRNKREVPELNTTSTADISFMFLIFFLVTTSMFVDKGVMRRLPPKEKDKQEQTNTDVDKADVMSLKLNSEGVVTVNDTVMEQSGLRKAMTEFILRRGKRHVIMIDAAPDCRYDAYFHVQNSLAEAYKDAREAIARRDYGRPMPQLTSSDREAVLEKCPQRVAENYDEGGGI